MGLAPDSRSAFLNEPMCNSVIIVEDNSVDVSIVKEALALEGLSERNIQVHWCPN